MNGDIFKQLKRLKIEDIIWFIYFFLIIANLISNNYERKYLINNNIKNKKLFKKINAIVLTIAFIIYIYFLITNYQNLKNAQKNISKKKNTEIHATLIASILFVIAGGIYAYYANKGVAEDEIAI